VDNRRYNRLAFRVLDHDPTQDDVLAFLNAFKAQLDRRGLSVRGVTTDGSSLYPKVLKKLWPEARHQLCTFHVIKEIIKAVLHALAKLRKEMTAQIPKQARGRPRKEQEGQAWLIAYRKRCVVELFEHRYLFVRHHLSPAEHKQLQKLMHGRRNCGRCAKSWKRCTGCSTAAAEPRRPCRSSRGCAGGCGASSSWAKL
jgi:hypothetical protein